MMLYCFCVISVFNSLGGVNGVFVFGIYISNIVIDDYYLEYVLDIGVVGGGCDDDILFWLDY